MTTATLDLTEPATEAPKSPTYPMSLTLRLELVVPAVHASRLPVLGVACNSADAVRSLYA